MTMTTGTYWERVGGLEFDIEDAEYERLSAPGGPGPAGEGDRITALLALHGGGHTGLAEEIGLMEPADYDTYAELARSLPLAGRWTIASFAAHIRTLPLFAEPPQWELMRNFRTWAFESAALDLALRQAETSLPALLDLTPRPITYVNSLGLGDPPSFAPVGQRLATYPEMRFKIDASFLWDRALIERLAATGAVRTVDFKGQYGMDVGTPEQMLAMYTAVIECFPDALLEDPHDIPEVTELLQPYRARVSYDAPVTTAAALDETAIRCGAVNVKPSRIGGLEELFKVYARCEADGLPMYGGGMGELGVARGQIQLLASLFHPDTFNDVAPSASTCPNRRPASRPAHLYPLGDLRLSLAVTQEFRPRSILAGRHSPFATPPKPAGKADYPGRMKPLWLVACLLVASAAAALAGAGAMSATLPSIYVDYGDDCVFTMRADGGIGLAAASAPGPTIPPGAYQIVLSVPQNAPSCPLEFQLQGPGVQLQWDFGGEAIPAQTVETLQPSSTYIATDLRNPARYRAVFTTAASGSSNSLVTQPAPVSGGKGELSQIPSARGCSPTAAR